MRAKKHIKQLSVKEYVKLFLLAVIAINLCFISYYSHKSCKISTEISDEDIHIQTKPEKISKGALTLDYVANLLNVIPETKVLKNGKYLYFPAQNSGFISRVINQIRREQPRYIAYDEVNKAIAQWQYRQYIAWQNYNKAKANSIEDLAEAAM